MGWLIMLGIIALLSSGPIGWTVLAILILLGGTL